MRYLINTPILTNYGTFDFKPITIDEAKSLMASGYTTAIGHVGTADLLTKVLNTKVEANRIPIKMEKGDDAIIFRLKSRLPEGVVLSEEELAKLDYEFGFLTKTL